MSERREKKKVLMFCSAFFGYDKRIADCLRSLGFCVDLFDERPSNGFVAKSCIRYRVKAYQSVMRRYVERVIRSAEPEYDYIFVVKGEALSPKCISLLRQRYPKAEMILYLWDSVSNIPDCEKKIPFYDHVFSFDPEDSERYGLHFRPLFFAEEYEAQGLPVQTNFRYDFSFIGTAHTIRPLMVKKLGEICRKRKKEYFSFLYLPHPLVFWYNKVFNKAYKTVSRSDISFTPMSAARIKQVYEESRCVLDVEHEKQKGLTMRTVELVGMKKKIITTNALVKQYDFYHPNNVFVIDRENPEVSESFWNAPYEEIPYEIFLRYSIRSFVRELFSLEEN